MFTVFVFYKDKELLTGEGCVGVVIPWQLCGTIGPLLSQRFPLASAKAQPRGGIFPSKNFTIIHLYSLDKSCKCGLFWRGSFKLGLCLRFVLIDELRYPSLRLSKLIFPLVS